MARALLLSALVALVAVASPSRAAACSSPQPGVVSVGPWLLQDGQGDVPTSVRPAVVLLGDTSVAVRLSLLGPGGAEVEGEQRRESAGPYRRALVQFVPAQSLEPSTAYTFTASRSDSDAGVGAFEDVFSLSFVTGAGPDVAPPAFAGLQSAVVTSKEVCDSRCSCGPYVTRHVLLSWEPATDDDALWYRIEAVDGRFLGFGGATSARGEADCESQGRPPFGEAFRWSGPYRVRAVDRSGNVSASEAALWPDKDCDDARVSPSDAGAEEASPDEGPDPVGGCGCGSTDAAWGVVLVAASLRRRARSGRNKAHRA